MNSSRPERFGRASFWVSGLSLWHAGSRDGCFRPLFIHIIEYLTEEKFMKNQKGGIVGQMRRGAVALGVGLAFATVSATATAGVFSITAAGPLTSSDINLSILNNDGFDLLKVTFDLSTTSKPLVFGGSFNLSGPAGGAATGFGVQNDSLWGFEFTGFNSGESFSFSWDPDIASNDSYGATVGEQDGMGITLETSGGTVSGKLVIVNNDHLEAIIASPVSEPETTALIAVGLGFAGLVGRRRKRAA